MIAGMTYYQICSFFLLYSFAGWVVEVIFHAVAQGKVVNRGFLNGPVCPVYGFGMLAVFALINSLPGGSGETNVGILFVAGMVLTTAIELLAGFILDRAFHARWWDYSDKPFNFHGYICLQFSILWGLGVVMAVRIAHPIITSVSTDRIPPKYGWPVLACCYAVYLVDFVVTVAVMQGLNRRLKEIDEISRLLHVPSDSLTKTIAESSMKTQGTIEAGRVQASLARAELTAKKDAIVRRTAELTRERRQELLERQERLKQEISAHPFFGAGRILRAFPQLEHRDYRELLQEAKARAEAAAHRVRGGIDAGKEEK